MFCIYLVFHSLQPRGKFPPAPAKCPAAPNFSRQTLPEMPDRFTISRLLA
jgi:hypothetical protein